MKKFLVMLAVLGLGSVAMADDFGCEIAMNGEYAVAYAETYRGRTAIVELNGYYCSGSMNDHAVRVYLYEPGETDDDDATKGYGTPSQRAIIHRPDLGVTCACGLH